MYAPRGPDRPGPYDAGPSDAEPQAAMSVGAGMKDSVWLRPRTSNVNFLLRNFLLR